MGEGVEGAFEAQALPDSRFRVNRKLRCLAKGGLPLGFQRGGFIVGDGIKIAQVQAPGAEAIPKGFNGEAGVMLDTGEPFFLGRGNQSAVLQQTTGGVMVKSGDPEDVHLLRSTF